MRKIFIVVFFILLFTGCKQSKPLAIDELQVYNDILDELVRHRFYYRYLDEKEVDSLWRYYNHNIRDKSDSIEFHKFIDKRTREIESDTAKQKFLLLKNKFIGRAAKAFPKFLISDSIKSLEDLRYAVRLVSSDLNRASDSLSQPQQRYHTEDFHSNVFKISSTRDEIGNIAFSKLIFNEDGSRAALYYEFQCDPDCGMGNILILYKENEKWKIKETHFLWIS